MHLTTNIAFAGLAAAGKTTHAKLLAESIGYDYVSATDLLLEILDIGKPADQIWFSHLEQINAARDDTSVDSELEKRLLELNRTGEKTVFDTWARQRFERTDHFHASTPELLKSLRWRTATESVHA